MSADESAASEHDEPTARLDSDTSASGRERSGRAEAARPQLGRYEVLERLGEGGMGVVDRAYDPTLDREVALKRVRLGSKGSSGSQEARLLREAQAMGKLSHPNVVPVFAAEVIDGEVVIAMELVEGETLGSHLRRTKPDWRAIVRLFIEAGRGLEAAHQADLVHRDFKPANVLVDRGGRVRVLDFGLARPIDGSLDAAPSDPRLRSASGSSSLTTIGSAVGTPRYMAPEQHTGGIVDARADQYALCVSLYAALFGVPPFVADHYDDLVQAKCDGVISPPPPSRARGIPRRLRRILERGLSPAPHLRYPDTGALLRALESTVAPSRTPRIVAAAGIGVTGLALAWSGDDGATACRDGAGRIAETWNDDARATLLARFEGLDAVGAGYTAQRVETRIDAFAQRWAEGFDGACAATHETGAQSAQDLDLRMACLRGQADALTATLTVLDETDATSVAHAVRTVTGLPDPTQCDDVDALRAGVTPPDDPVTRDAVANVRRDLERVDALVRAGRYDDAHREAETTVAAAEATAYRPAVIEAHGRLGMIEERLGNYDEAVSLLTNAYHEARALDHGVEVVRNALHLVYIEGYRRQDAEAADRWGREARAEIDRRGTDEDALASLASHAGMNAMIQGNSDEAIEQFAYVLDFEKRADPPDPLGLASAHDRLGTVYYTIERNDEAQEHFAAALEIYDRELGPEHVKLIPCLANLGGSLATVRRFDESLSYLQRAEVIALATYDEQSADVGMIRNHLGNTLSLLGRHDEADKAFSAAATALQATLGPEHQYTVGVVANWGAALDRRGDRQGALEKYQATLEISRRLLPPDHPAIADYTSNVGMTLSQLGRHEEALPYHREALPIFEKTYGADSSAYALGLAHVGRSLLALGHHAEALPILERSVAIPLPDHIPAFDAAPPRFALAQALWHEGDHARARAMAEDARARLDAAALDSDAIARWLAAHEP